MTNKSYQIVSGNGRQMYCSCWRPNSETEAVLFIVHGLGEHSGRYEEMATTFTDQKISVFSFDLPGHGQSEGRRGHAQSLGQLIEDIELALMKCRSLFLDIPIFIFGHSMGGQLAATFIQKAKSKELSGAIISSPWFELTNPPPFWQLKLIRFLEKIAPQFTLSNKIDSQHISSVKEEVEMYEKDELIHDKISFRLFNELFNNGIEMLQKESEVKIPVLVSHGDLDKITLPAASKNYQQKLGSYSTFISWKGSFHEAHHDHEKEKVIQFYVDWIKKNL